MRNLFIDTSSKDLTIAVTSLNEIFSISHIKNLDKHSLYAIKSFKETIDNSNIKSNEIDKVFVINGPGSFTGIRIGVTIAKTYAWSLNKPLIPISSLHAYALSYKDYSYYISVIDARRGYVYASIYDDKYNVYLEEKYISIEELLTKISKIDNYIIIGNINIGEYNSIYPELDIVKIINYYNNHESINPHSLKPNYLKKVEAEEQLMLNNK